MNLNSYRDLCGRAAEENGWHNGYKDALTFDSMRAVTDHIVAKTALIGCEVAEAIEELRDGHAPTETYYSVTNKPEGYPSELADVIIRALDIAYMLDIDIDQIVEEKLGFNATRGRMHGGKKL